ncbi:MAG: response regulator [Pyrinomonadaceae bacterium]
MSNAAQTNAVSRHNRDARTRRLLVIADSSVGVSLPLQLAKAGYDARVVRTDKASQAIAEFAPHVALIETGGDESGEARLELAHRLRAGRATSALPLILLFEHDDVQVRASALSLGADDYLALATPPAEIAARLDALFWRIAAGRRTAAFGVLEQRAEIDDFLQLLDAVRADIDEGASGVLALLAADAHEEISSGAAQENRLLAGAYDFFKLNLRRIDSIAFYGPTLLLVYLPHKRAGVAQVDLARLSDEFLAETQPGGVLKIGLASFPADGTEIETLIEQAEAALISSDAPPSTRGTMDNSFSLTDAPARESPIGNTSAPPAASLASRALTAPTTETVAAERESRSGQPPPSRAVRESRQADAVETSSVPAGGAGSMTTSGQGALERAAVDAAARERERRSRGAIMPRRLLLTVSDPARMAQINLLLRSAGYEVRAAFDGLQAINLLRIERPDLLVIDDALTGIDGLEALRRLHRQHHGRLPLPVLFLLSEAATRADARVEAESLGVGGFVNVPYDAEELLMSVRNVGSTD